MPVINSILRAKKSILLEVIYIILFLIIVMDAPVYSATFSGKIIDADTKEPIVGAVVVASWNEEKAVIAEGGMRLKDVKETLTDKEGKWVINGPQGRIMGNFTSIISYITGIYITRPPDFIIFKPGYCSYPKGLFIAACTGLGSNQTGNGETTELSKLMNKEDRLRNLPGYKSDGGAINNKEAIIKQKEFIRLLDKESRNLGISEYKMKELENEK